MVKKIVTKDFIFKFGFIYSGKTRLADKIYNQFLEENQDFQLLSTFELCKRLLGICRLVNNNKAHLAKVFIDSITFRKFKKSSFILKLQTLPTIKKEIALLYFLMDLPTNEMSKIFNLQEGKLKSIVKKLEIELIPYFPVDDLLIKEHLKNAVNQLNMLEHEKLLNKEHAKNVKLSLIISSTIAVPLLFVSILGLTNMSPSNNDKSNLATTSTNKENDQRQLNKESDIEDEKNTEVEAPSESVNPKISESPILMHMPKLITFQIAKYNFFYNTPFFYSSNQSKYYSARELLELYFVRKHMYDFNMELTNLDKRGLMNWSNVTFKSSMENEAEAVYINQVLNALDITEEEYITQFQYPKHEYHDLLEKLYKFEVGLDSFENRYTLYAIPSIFYEYADIPKEEFEKMGGLLSKTSIYYIEENPEGLPFNIEGTTLSISSKNGEFYIDNPEQFMIESTVYSQFYFDFIVNTVGGVTLSRSTFHMIMSMLENFSSEDKQDNILASELLELLKALERSIEWEFEG